MYPKKWTEERIAESMRRWAKLHGRQPTFNGWPRRNRSYPSHTTVMEVFGSWWNALVYAGFEPRLPGNWINHDEMDEENERLLGRWEAGESFASMAREMGMTGQALGRRLALYQRERREEFLRKLGGAA